MPEHDSRWQDADPRMSRRFVKVYAIQDDGRIAIQDERTGRITRVSGDRFYRAFKPAGPRS